MVWGWLPSAVSNELCCYVCVLLLVYMIAILNIILLALWLIKTSLTYLFISVQTRALLCSLCVSKGIGSSLSLAGYNEMSSLLQGQGKYVQVHPHLNSYTNSLDGFYQRQSKLNTHDCYGCIPKFHLKKVRAYSHLSFWNSKLKFRSLFFIMMRKVFDALTQSISLYITIPNSWWHKNGYAD